MSRKEKNNNPFTLLLANTSHGELSDVLQVSRQALHNWHHGHALPGKANIDKIKLNYPSVTVEDVHSHYDAIQTRRKERNL